jgi:undecaprenyl diphosphate synthase
MRVRFTATAQPVRATPIPSPGPKTHRRQRRPSCGRGSHGGLGSAAAQNLARACASGARPEEISEERFAGALALAGLPEADLLIRTGGEQRVSNFLLWDLAYAELYFTPRLWPEFELADLEAAFAFFASRERRFGQTAAQRTS